LVPAANIPGNHVPTPGVYLVGPIIPGTWYLIPGSLAYISGTSNWLPAASCQLPATSYQLPATSYQLPATSYQLPGTYQVGTYQVWYQVPVRSTEPGTYRNVCVCVHTTHQQLCCMLQSARYLVPGTRNQVRGTRYQVPGMATRYHQVPGSSSSLPGIIPGTYLVPR